MTPVERELLEAACEYIAAKESHRQSLDRRYSRMLRAWIALKRRVAA